MIVCSVAFYFSWGAWFCSLQIEKAETDQGNDKENLLGLFIDAQVGDLFRYWMAWSALSLKSAS